MVTNAGDCFFFDYGIVACWGLTKVQELAVVGWGGWAVGWLAGGKMCVYIFAEEGGQCGAW